MNSCSEYSKRQKSTAAAALAASTCIAMLLASLAPCRAEQSAELQILNSWRSTARQTQLGNELLAVLDSTYAAIKENPKNVTAFYKRGYLFGIIGCTNWAIADLSRAIELSPRYAAAYTDRGICYMDLKNYDRATADLEKAISLDPASADAHFARGKLLLDKNNPQQAEADFRACQSGYCKFSPVLPGELPANYYDGPDYYIGACEELLGRHDSALRYFKLSTAKAGRLGGAGYIKRYSDQPLDTRYHISRLEQN